MKSLLIAFSTLTIFPVPAGRWTRAQLKNSVIFYPLVGAVLGGFLNLGAIAPVPVSLKSLCVLGLWIALTLAFHLDGVADCLDGWLGGKTRAQRIRIMKDPSIGVYGAVGILFILLSKYVCLNQLFAQPEYWKWLLVIPMAARWAVSFSCFLNSPLSPAKGLASHLMGQSPLSFGWSSLFLAGASFLLGWNLLFMAAVSAAIALILNGLSHARIGRLTGDGLGATIEWTEIALLFLAALKPL